MTNESGRRRRRAVLPEEEGRRALTPEQQKAKRLCDHALKFGEQGRLAVADFHRGNAVLGTHTWKQRFEQLTLDMLDIEDGKVVFGTPEALGMEKVYPKSLLDQVKNRFGGAGNTKPQDRSQGRHAAPAPPSKDRPGPGVGTTNGPADQGVAEKDTQSPEPPNRFVGDGSKMEFDDDIPF